MPHTNSQRMAQEAYLCARRRMPHKEYASFARSFPSLIHACGLAQAIAFARAKKEGEYLDDIAAVLRIIGHTEAASTGELETATRESHVRAYVRLSRNALQAAGWLKRYVESFDEG